MPVLTIQCPECSHTYQSLVMEGTRQPEVWTCSACGGKEAEPISTAESKPRPWADGCIDACCG